MFGRIVVSALFAGCLTGIIAGFLQWWFVQPVLLHAELYESGALTHISGIASNAHPEINHFQPIRDVLSFLFNMLIYTGYALLLIVTMTTRQIQTQKDIPLNHGILWGIAGFFALHMAPAISLPPEVPGVASADIQLRQIWWAATVIITAASLWIIAFNLNLSRFLIGGIMLLLPHFIGAPETDIFTGLAPTEIGALFASRTIGISLISWAVLGILSVIFLTYETKRTEN